MRKFVGLFLLTLFAVAFAAVNVSSKPEDGPSGEAVLQWHSMAAVQSPYFSISVPFTPVDGVGGGNARWTIDKGWGMLRSNGELRVHTRGLILPDPPFNGTNPLPEFRVLVNCRTVDVLGAAVTVGTMSENYPASIEGDSDLVTTMTLPTPCYAPTVFVMHPTAPRWFATLGYN